MPTLSQYYTLQFFYLLHPNFTDKKGSNFFCERFFQRFDQNIGNVSLTRGFKNFGEEKLHAINITIKLCNNNNPPLFLIKAAFFFIPRPIIRGCLYLIFWSPPCMPSHQITDNIWTISDVEELVLSACKVTPFNSQSFKVCEQDQHTDILAFE